MNIGKIQPQATEIEAFLLGSIIKSQVSYDLVSALLRPEHFYKKE